MTPCHRDHQPARPSPPSWRQQVADLFNATVIETLDFPADDLASRAEVSPVNLTIVITENRDADWWFGDGRTQFLEGTRGV